MMVGKLWWNLVFALMGALMVYILSIGENTLSTTALRSSGTFILFFLLLFLFRWAIGYASENHYAVAQSYESEETKTYPETSEATAHTFPSDEQMLNNQSDGETESQNELSEEEAKKTSEMIRSLLDDDE
ncbi:hypothetical protein [Pontibacillus sp. HMF3514]|uniref:hypothetical protein n=1 Tax=Pontibacillus sp. HMF3514 TaxID=2692425 RepID=UPI0013202C5B|nr:hypothetical protein [Pontibacillus sp. HMF3514]QHE52213.1 hypothetical protein GS400_09295 [Pontibacillus sp. HMF3514]